jgi:hypothetical protein
MDYVKRGHLNIEYQHRECKLTIELKVLKHKMHQYSLLKKLNVRKEANQFKLDQIFFLRGCGGEGVNRRGGIPAVTR